MIRIIETDEELAALPDHSVIVDGSDRVREGWTVRGRRCWFKPGSDMPADSVPLPAVLLHVRGQA